MAQVVPQECIRWGLSLARNSQRLLCNFWGTSGRYAPNGAVNEPPGTNESPRRLITPNTKHSATSDPNLGRTGCAPLIFFRGIGTRCCFSRLKMRPIRQASTTQLLTTGFRVGCEFRDSSIAREMSRFRWQLHGLHGYPTALGKRGTRT